MIPKIKTGTGGTYGLIRYLYGPGRHNEHADPHLVASWNDFAPDPGRNSDHSISRLAAQLDLPVNALRPNQRPHDTIWHCSVRAAPRDRQLTDAEWADIARRVVAAAGIAPTGDISGCRWVAVRHADDHIHIAATLVRQDGRRPKRSFDMRNVQTEARQIEKDLGLRKLNPGDGTASKRPTSAERFKADRQGHTYTARERLRTKVRQAVAAAENEAEFFALLERLGVTVEQRRLPSGDIGGYRVALPGDTNAESDPVWFAGSTLAADLSLPKIRKRLDTVDLSQPESDPWHAATTVVAQIPHQLRGGDDQSSQAYLTALDELIGITAATAPAGIRDQIQAAAMQFERASRSQLRPQHNKASSLANAARQILRSGGGRDGGTLAMTLSAIIAAAIAAARWHEQRGHQQQATAAWKSTVHLQAAYQLAAAQPLAELAHRAPGPGTMRRFECDLRQVLPAHAERIRTDPSWPALAATLSDAEPQGHRPLDLLQQAAQNHDLSATNSPAEALLWISTNRMRSRGHEKRVEAATARPRVTAPPISRTAAASSEAAVPHSETFVRDAPRRRR